MNLRNNALHRLMMNVLAALTVVAFLLPPSGALAQGKGKGGNGNGGGGGEEPAAAYLLIDLFGFPGSNYQSSAKFITNQDQDGNTLIYGSARLPDAGSVPFPAALWHVDLDGNFPLTDAEDRGIPSWSKGIDQTGINNSGVMVGNTATASEKDGGAWVFPAYLDHPDHGYQEIPSPLTRNTNMYGINNSGKIVGNYEDLVDPADPTSGLATFGALWQLNANGISDPRNLGLFYPHDINNYGVMAGRYKGYPAIAWLDETATLQIVQLDASLEFFGADAHALNDRPIGDNQLTIVGRAFRDELGNPVPMQGFGWRPYDIDNPTTLLGTLGGLESEAKDVNIHGEIVGWSDTRRSGQHAFLFKDGKMKDLNSLVDAGKNNLQFALGINDDHDIIGFMYLPKPVSEQHGFLLRLVPPPGE